MSASVAPLTGTLLVITLVMAFFLAFARLLSQPRPDRRRRSAEGGYAGGGDGGGSGGGCDAGSSGGCDGGGGGGGDG
jgi:hypothetical protein